MLQNRKTEIYDPNIKAWKRATKSEESKMKT